MTDKKTQAAILSLPHVHHPKLNPLVMHLSNRDGIDFQMAVSLLEDMRKAMGISTMDVQFAAPGAFPKVCFGAAPVGPQMTDYQAQVAGHLRRIIGGYACR